MANSRQYLGPVDDNKAIATKEYVDANTLPTITTGDSGKVLVVKIDESGAEWSNGTEFVKTAVDYYLLEGDPA